MRRIRFAHRYPAYQGHGRIYVARILGTDREYGFARGFIDEAVTEKTWRGGQPTRYAMVLVPAEDGLYEVQSFDEQGRRERRYWRVAGGQAVEISEAEAGEGARALERARSGPEDSAGSGA